MESDYTMMRSVSCLKSSMWNSFMLLVSSNLEVNPADFFGYARKFD